MDEVSFFDSAFLYFVISYLPVTKVVVNKFAFVVITFLLSLFYNSFHMHVAHIIND
jgi:hypothetical protein